jgi:hypothetical protein
MAVDILPDTRARRATGVIRSSEGNLVPIHCANCGRRWGMVPEKHITFAFALCEACEEKHGHPAHFYKEPDEVFWVRVRAAEEEQRRKDAWPTTPEAFLKALSEPGSVVAKLAKEWENRVLKTT